MDDEIGPVLLILAAPDELRVEVGVARIFYRLGLLLFFLKDGLILGSGNILALVLLVSEGFDAFSGCLLSTSLP